jgi:hypothetical protein
MHRVSTDGAVSGLSRLDFCSMPRTTKRASLGRGRRSAARGKQPARRSHLWSHFLSINVQRHGARGDA